MIFSCFRRRSFQNVIQPRWIVYDDFYSVAIEVISLAWRLRLDPIVGLNAPKPIPIYASLGLAFHPKGALPTRKCIAQYRLKFQISHCQISFLDPPLLSSTMLNVITLAFSARKNYRPAITGLTTCMSGGGGGVGG